ncbi:MAG TPA: heparinase II/III family protein, partial [Herpetosiphonaceae bacterium]
GAQYLRFKQWVDRAVFQQSPGYAYTPADAVVMYAITGEAAYITHAIAKADALVAEAEALIAQGQRPAVSYDSYLEAWWHIEQIALAYDHGYDRLTAQQRTRWTAYMQQTVYNIWHPEQASWGGTPHPWTGWGTDDPGNNYFFGHLKTTMYVALALQDTQLISFLRTAKFPEIADYYADLPGGGTREGTGYGTAIGSLFDDFRLWKTATGEDLSQQTPHTRETLAYWVHATVPTGDRFAPIGDQSRVSNPEIFDYHRNLMIQGMALAPGAAEAGQAAWWLDSIDLTQNSQGYALRPALLEPAVAPQAPPARVYHATGTGDLFARSAWTEDALWLAVKAGPYDQSHAHNDQGSFTLHKRDWLAVTSNVWSRSGLQGNGAGTLATAVHNTLRFTRNGGLIKQNNSVSSMTVSTQGAVTTVNAALGNAYSSNASLVRGWTRQFVFNADQQSLRVVDACQVAADVRAVFQVHVPVQPVAQPSGSLRAGDLEILPGAGMTVATVNMRAVDADFNSGWRIDITNPAGCAYDVTLRVPSAMNLPRRVYLPVARR